MGEELKHIDLIDKYLKGQLTEREVTKVEKRLKEEPDFRAEVEFYRQMYKGIAQQGETALRERLDAYYREHTLKSTKGTRGLYRRLVIYGGSIAAVLVTGWFLYDNLTKQPFTWEPVEPTVVTDSTRVLPKDSLADPTKEEQLVRDEHIRDSIVPKAPEDQLAGDENMGKGNDQDTVSLPDGLNNDIQLALGGFKQLRSTAIRTADVSGTLYYTFSEKVLTIYGDPLISGLQLQVQKNKKGDYGLVYQDSYYLIRETGTRTLLKAVEPGPKSPFGNGISGNVVKGVPSNEKIKLKVANIDQISGQLNSLDVLYKEEPGTPTYLFREQTGKKQLLITADLDFDALEVYRVRMGTKTTYHLRLGTKLFSLDPKISISTPLVETDMLGSRTTRLFMERDTLEMVVYRLNK